MNSRVFPLLLVFSVVFASYEYIPGRPYELMLIKLNASQLAEVKELIYDPDRSRADTLQAMKMWAYRQSPLTEQALDRSLFEYDQRQMRENERILQRAQTVSAEAHDLEVSLRSIYNDIDLSEREACQQTNASILNATEVVRREVDVQPQNCDEILAKFASN
ncbi:hypothetical protein M3Y99_01123700 [Aphelenchoides fujianensis]|nr:hypothetical protein M3Y99_01123700 [Aphelenchoides fujianensis]